MPEFKNLTGSAGTFPVRRSGLTLECGAPVPLWIWYDVTNIQQMPEYRSFAAELKRRRVAETGSGAGSATPPCSRQEFPITNSE